MASNTTLNTGAGGDIIATKERTHDGDATKVQVVTLAGVTGTEGSYTYGDINGDATNGLDVDVTRVGGGGVAHDGSATSQNPLTVGGYASAAAPTDVSADGDAVRAWMLRNGAQATVITAAGALVGGDATNGLDVDVTRSALPTGASTSANQTTIIGHLDGVEGLLTTIDADTSNLNTAIKTEDAAHGSGDTGFMALAVRRDANTTLVDTTGDYAPLQVDSSGNLKVAIISGAGSGGTSMADGATFTRDTTSLTPVGAVVESSAPTLTNGDVAGLSQTTGGALRVAVASGGISGVVDDAAVTPATTEGVMIMAMADETSPDSVDEGDGGMLRMTLARALHINVRDDAGDSCMDGTNNALRVNIVAGAGSGGTSVTDDAAYTVGSGALTPAGGYYNSTRDLVDSGDVGTFAMNARRAQYITSDSFTSTANSTTANLANGAVFTGTAEDVTEYSQIQVSVFSSHVSATDGLSLQQSSDGTNWDIVDTFTIPASTGKTFSVQVAARYYRLVYTNGGTLTTSLRIQSVFKVFAGKASSQRPGDATSNENDFDMVSSFLHGYNGTTWDRLRTTGTGILTVSAAVTALPASTNTIEVVGDAATDAAVSGNPVYIAGRGNSGTPTAMSANNDVTPLWLTLNGAAVVAGEIVDDAAFTPATSRVVPVGYTADDTSTDSVDEGDIGAARMTLNRKQITQPYESEANTWSYAAAAGGLVNTTGVTAKAAAGAGLRNYITSIQVINSHQTTGTEVVVRDGAAGTVIHRGWAAPNAGYAAEFPVPLRGTANTLLEIAEVTTTATAGVLVNLQGYVGA